jgi:hypothetical protein
MKTVASLPLSEAGVVVKSGSALVLSRARPRPLPIPRITPRLGPSIAICDAEYAPPRLLQYFNEPPSRLSRCQVRRRIALNIAKLPELIGEKRSPKQVTRGFLSACLATTWLVAQLNTTE